MNKRGISLIELTMMIGISAVLVTTLTISVQTLIASSVDQRDYLVALNLAKRQMAIMNNLTLPGVASEAAVTPTDPDFPNFTITQEVSDVDTNGGLSLRQVWVRVRRGSISGEVLVALYTYRTDLVTFGSGT